MCFKIANLGAAKNDISSKSFLPQGLYYVLGGVFIPHKNTQTDIRIVIVVTHDTSDNIIRRKARNIYAP